MKLDPSGMRRREFVRAGAILSTVAISSGIASPAAEPTPSLPTRSLGKTGLKLTIVTLEASRSAVSLGRLLPFAFANGVRSFDTADCYASSEPSVASWLEASPRVREAIFVCTKDHPREPSELEAMLDRRLTVLKLDQVDLFLIHNLGSRSRFEETVALVKSPALKAAIQVLKKSGKTKLVGFSTHHREQARMIEAAAEGGFIDAIMLDYPFGQKQTSAFNRALDMAHRRGVGLIATRQSDPVRLLDTAARPKISPLQAALHAIWSDERISSCSLSLRNTDEIREVASTARTFGKARSTTPG